MITLEICAQSIQAAIHAYEGGADRVELCIDLPVGGLTPSPKLIKQVCHEIDIPVYVLVRSRAGNFMYSKVEIDIMQDQIKSSVQAGASGIVAGALNDKYFIDTQALEIFMKAADGLPFTFHRAIESVKNIHLSLDLLMEYNVNRILTGGAGGNAYTCRTELSEINKYLNGQMILLAGSGITSENVEQLIVETNVKEVHTSAKLGNAANRQQNPFDTNTDEVKRIKSIIMQMN